MSEKIIPAIEETVKNTVRAFVESWIEEHGKRELHQALKKMTPVFDRCVEEAARKFQKDFVAKLGLQGKAVLTEGLKTSFDEVGKVFSEVERFNNKEKEEADKEFSITSSPMLPPHARFWWQFSADKATYDLFCFEFAPQTRTIKLLSSFRRVAFPWCVVFVCFQNGKLYDYTNVEGNHSGFWLFYRPSALVSLSDTLWFPNLPHIWKEWPHGFCLGYSIPTIKLSDPKWFTTLMDYFWDTDFRSPQWWLWRDATERIPEIATEEKWEKLSQESPEKMLSFPWKKMDETLEQFVRSLCKKQFTSLERQNEKVAPPDKNKAAVAIIDRFVERLEEELAFLGGHLLLVPETEKTARAFTENTIGEVEHELAKSFIDHCRKVLVKAIKQLEREV